MTRAEALRGLKRYSLDWEGCYDMISYFMDEDPEGEWVKLSDVRALLAQEDTGEAG